MKLLRSWLQDWIDLTDIDDTDLSTALESLGFEIEDYKLINPDYKNIIVGKVLEIYPHPNADKVRVTKVDVGNKIYEIVCGAWNFEEGAIVPVALPNSYIKDSFKIDKRDIRGVESNGMICSASELNLWDEHDGILILDESFKIGSDLSKTYNSTDSYWEVGVTPNRGDCMSYLGIARELSTYFNKKLKKIEKPLNPKLKPVLKVNSGKSKLCSSYQSIEIENISIKDSSFLIKYRLSNIGVRIINNVVDYTNYVLHDIGQPLHAFDRDKLYGTISVRKAKEGEKLKTLDEQIRTLDNDDLIITDNNEPIALAGVMGGFDTEVTNETRNLLIESAYFDKVSIMKTSRKLNLISDASVRFERGIDRNIQAYGLKRFTNLYELDENIQYSEISDSSKQTESENFITFDTSLIESILGQVIDNKFITSTLKSLSIESEIKKDTIKFKQPSWRYDLERPIDLIEEIAKHYGFNNFKSTLPIGNNLNQVGNYWNVRKYFIDKLSLEKFNETQSLSFTQKEYNEFFDPDKEGVKVLNPIDQTQEYLRTNLYYSLIKIYKFNYDQNNFSGKYFEINNIYNNSTNKNYKKIPKQDYTLGFLVPDNNSDINPMQYIASLLRKILPGVSFEQLSKPGFHQNNSYVIMVDNKLVGHTGQLSYLLKEELDLSENLFLSQIYLEELNFEGLNTSNYKPLSHYPFIKFDLSFKVNRDLNANDLIQEVENLLQNNENSIKVFDDYAFEKTRNLGIRIITRSYEKTYNEKENTEILNMIVDKLTSKFNITLNEKGE